MSLISMMMVLYVHAYTLDLNGYAGALTPDKNYNTFIQDMISHGFMRVASPVFFIISGFLLFFKFDLSSSTILLNYRKRVRSLLVPFLLWSAIGILIYYVLQLSPALKPFFSNRIISELTLIQLLDTLVLNPIPYQLWFVRNLIVLVLLSPIVWITVRYLKEPILLVILACWIAEIDLVLFRSDALFFFSIGCLLAQKPSLLKRKGVPGWYPVLLLTWGGIVILKTALATGGYDNLFVLMLLHKVAIVVGIVALWSVVSIVATQYPDLLNKKLINHYITPFFIYTFHEPVLTILKKGALAVLPSDTHFPVLLVYLLVPLVVVLLAIVTSQVLKLYAPWLFSLLTGSRHHSKPAPAPQVAPMPVQRVEDSY
ncbi:MAG TPA: acyltransferase [Pontibacter sp.]